MHLANMRAERRPRGLHGSHARRSHARKALKQLALRFTCNTRAGGARQANTSQALKLFRKRAMRARSTATAGVRDASLPPAHDNSAKRSPQAPGSSAPAVPAAVPTRSPVSMQVPARASSSVAATEQVARPRTHTQIRGSIVVSISARHAEDPGSIPGRGV